MRIHQLPRDCACRLFTYLTNILADSSMTGLACFIAVVGVIACLMAGSCAQSKWNIVCSMLNETVNNTTERGANREMIVILLCYLIIFKKVFSLFSLHLREYIGISECVHGRSDMT